MSSKIVRAIVMVAKTEGERLEKRQRCKTINFANAFGFALFAASLFATPPLRSQTSSQCTESKLLVNALNRDYHRIEGLNAADFVLTLGKKPVSVTRVEKLPLAPRVIVLVDVSGSMGEHPLPDAERFVVHTLLQEFPTDVPIAVMTFSNDPRLIANFSLDRASLWSSVSPVLSDGKTWMGLTHLDSAIAKALETFGSPRIGDSILLVSDGGANWNKHYGFADGRSLNSSGVRLFAHLWNEADYKATSKEMEGQSVTSGAVSGAMFQVMEGQSVTLHAIEKTGGFLFWSDPEDLEQSAKIVDIDRELVRQIVFPYLMTVQLDDSQRNWTPVRVQLDHKKVSGHRTIRLRYPKELPPCTNSDPS
ncbi:MAG: hypothetical protein JWO20_1503 [Candidatus Angelobacter sp.]|jgi:hypothetical protein|nr:hypothetical protein [Candidatus Angelobacter sp.]